MRSRIVSPLSALLLFASFAAAGTPPFDEPHSFEGFVDVSGEFTLGEAPNRVTFRNGQVRTVGDFRVYLTGVQAFMVAAGETASIEFETPAEKLKFFIRGQFGVTVRARLFDEDGVLVLSRTAESGSDWIEVSFASEEFPNRFVKSVELINVSGDGFGALEHMTYCARAQETPPEPEPVFDNVIHFAQFGNGGGLTSQILLENLGTSETEVRVELFDNSGDPFMVNINGEPADGLVELAIPAKGLRFLETDGVGEEALAGSVTVRSEEPLSGVVVFGGAFGLAGVGATEDFSDGFTAPIDSRAPEVRTGVAIQNLDESANTMTVCLLTVDAQVVATAEITLPGKGRIAQFADEFIWDAEIDFSDFRGILQVTPEEDVSGTAIQLRPGQFASLPVTKVELAQ